MEKELGAMVRLLISHALAVNYRHRAAAEFNVWAYRQGVAVLEENLYGAAQVFGLAKAIWLVKCLASAIPWLDFKQTRALLVIN
jgi:hypothetical protein